MRKLLLNAIVLLIGFAGVSSSIPTEVQAQQTQIGSSKVDEVQLEVPYTSFLVRGVASPGALVTIYLEDELAGSVVADDNGIFEKVLNSVSAGLHKLSLEYDDKEGLRSSRVTEIVSARQQTQISADFFLPPTVQIVPNILTQGELMVVRGSTAPGATVEIVLDGGRETVYPVADENGIYSVTLNTTGYYIGNHSIVATSFDGLLTSYPTINKPFSVSLPDTGIITTSGADDLSPDPASSNAPDPPVIDGSDMIRESDREVVVVSGTSQPYSQILLYIDNLPVGSTFTNGDGEWIMTITIHGGLNQIQAISCFDGTCSGLSDIADIMFVGELGVCNARTFNLVSYRFWGIGTGDTVTLNVNNLQFNNPATVLIDWGDETSELSELDTSQPFSPDHVYEKEGQFNASISIGDADDCQLTRYFTVDVSDTFKISSLWWAAVGALGVSLIGWEAYRIVRKRHRIRTAKLLEEN